MSDFFEHVESGYSFDDVLLVPSYSEIESRKFVDTSSEIVNGLKFEIPFVSANMNSVTEKDMILAMNEVGANGALHRFLDFEYFKKQIESIHESCKGNFGISVGINIDQIDQFINFAGEKCGYVIIDIAHGHHKYMKTAIKHIQKNYPKVKIVAGNICTAQAALDLADLGAHTLKVGVGGGCWTEDTPVFTEFGYKKISDIRIGDRVFTHLNRLKKVVATTQREEKEKLYSINGNKCTGNHEIYVINKKMHEMMNPENVLVNFNNIDAYAEWRSAEYIDDNWLLVKLSGNGQYEYIELEKEEISFNGIVYDLEVEEDHSYNVNKIAVHNSACSTRIISGCGYPQLSAIKNVAEVIQEINAYDKRNIKIIADGGLKTSGDCVKSLAAGADFLMMGNLLAGTKETPGDVVTQGFSAENKVKIYQGSASYNAQINHFNKEKKEVYAEGVTTFVKYKGTVKDVVHNLLKGIRSGMSYCGCKNIEELHEYGTMESSWTKISYSSLLESRPHILKEN